MLETTDASQDEARQDAPRRIDWRRVFLPALVVLLGFLAFGVGGNLSSKLAGVTENDQAAFLPDSA